MSLISIIMPTYNRSDLICNSIESCLKQSYKNYELIIVDDGSTDNTEKIVQSFLKDKAINYQYVIQKNAGASNARNKGLEYISGEYVYFLDSDDLLTENGLELFYTAMKNEICDYVFANTYEFYYYPFLNIKNANTLIKRDIYSCNNAFYYHFIDFGSRQNGILYSRRIFETDKFRTDLRYSEDTLFNQLVFKKFKGKVINDYVAYVRNHSGNKSKSLQKRNEIIKSNIKCLKQMFLIEKSYKKIGTVIYKNRLNEIRQGSWLSSKRLVTSNILFWSMYVLYKKFK